MPVANCARWLSAARSISSVSRCGDEDQRLLFRGSPLYGAWRPATRCGRRSRPWTGLARAAGRRPPSTASSAAPEASARRIRSSLSRCDDGVGRRRAAHGFLNRVAQLGALGIEQVDRNADARRQAADVGPARGTGARGQRRALGEAGLETHLLGKLVRAQQLQQPEEPVRIVFERRGAQQQHVAAKRRNGRDGAPARFAGVTRRTPQPLRFVHDQQVDAGFHGLIGEVRTGDQHLERDHGARVELEGVEVVAEVLGHVAEPLGVEQREHLVILAPQLAQPLHRERVWCHDHAAPDLAGVDQPIQDERRFDGLAEADFVGQQPAHGIGGAGALGDVQLMREQAHASAQERPQAVGFANGQQVQDVHPRHEVVHVVQVADDEASRAARLRARAATARAAGSVRPFTSCRRAVGQPRWQWSFLRGSR